MLRVQYTEDPDVRSVCLFQTLQGASGDNRELQVGRGFDSDVVLDSRRVPLLISRKHATLSRSGEELFLQDKGSTNGTFVNDVRLQGAEKRVLSEGDQISFGGAKLLRQAHNDYDEPNPFLFELTDLSRLFAHGMPHALPDTQPPAVGFAACDVIDLTANDSPSNFFGAGPMAASRKRGRQHAAIDLEDFDSDTDVSEFKITDIRGGAGVPPPPPAAPQAGPEPAGGAAAMLRTLEGQFECTICREFMVAAHSLVPCGHMFCGECVGEWIGKKMSCPSCRAAVTAAPVPCLSVDNMLEEVVAPQLDADAKRERARRQATWAAKGKQLVAGLQQRFAHGGSGGGSRGSGHDALTAHLHAALPTFPGLHDLMQMTWGATLGRGGAARSALLVQGHVDGMLPPAAAPAARHSSTTRRARASARVVSRERLAAAAEIRQARMDLQASQGPQRMQTRAQARLRS